jgi:hypothetical protein
MLFLNILVFVLDFIEPFSFVDQERNLIQTVLEKAAIVMFNLFVSCFGVFVQT